MLARIADQANVTLSPERDVITQLSGAVPSVPVNSPLKFLSIHRAVNLASVSAFFALLFSSPSVFSEISIDIDITLFLLITFRF